MWSSTCHWEVFLALLSLNFLMFSLEIALSVVRHFRFGNLICVIKKKYGTSLLFVLISDRHSIFHLPKYTEKNRKKNQQANKNIKKGSSFNFNIYSKNRRKKKPETYIHLSWGYLNCSLFILANNYIYFYSIIIHFLSYFLIFLYFSVFI